jgi:hypothetical protein
MKDINMKMLHCFTAMNVTLVHAMLLKDILELRGYEMLACVLRGVAYVILPCDCQADQGDHKPFITASVKQSLFCSALEYCIQVNYQLF